MKYLYLLLLAGILYLSPTAKSQVVFATGNATGSTQLIPYTMPLTCIANGVANSNSCGVSVVFTFTNTQISSCPTSGQIVAPGSVAYGGTGSSASFLDYHTLSYSPSNEDQRLTFGSKITKFQWSCSGQLAHPLSFFRFKYAMAQRW